MLKQYPQLQAEGFQESDSNGDFSAGKIRTNLSKLSLTSSPTELPNQSKVQSLKNIGSIFSQPTIIKTLGSKGNRQDLLKLKQLSSLYYQLLNTIYLDIVGKTIYIFCIRQKFLNDPGKEVKPSIQVLKENYGTTWKDSYGDPPEIPEIWTWTPTLAHIFRKIELNSLWLDEPLLQIAGINLNNLISHLAPYITVLDLGKKSMNLLYNETPTNLLEFIQQFSKLKELNICHNGVYDWDNRSGGVVSLTELELLFQKLSRSVKVNLTVYKYYEPVLERFGNVTGITIFIEVLWDAVSVIESYGNIKNVKFVIYAHNDIQEIVQFTSLCVKHKDKVAFAAISLSKFSDRNLLNETNVKQCLFQLSSFIHYLTVYENYSQWNIFTPGICFLLLNHLEIWGLQHSLDFLSDCPKLRCLCLYKLDQDLSIFYNPEKSHKEALMECFGKLRKLECLRITSKVGTVDRVGLGTELRTYLKELLPKGTYFEEDNFIRLKKAIG